MGDYNEANESFLLAVNFFLRFLITKAIFDMFEKCKKSKITKKRYIFV